MCIKTFFLHSRTHSAELEKDANDTSGNDVSKEKGEELWLNCSVAPTTPLPWLYWVKLPNGEPSRDQIQTNASVTLGNIFADNATHTLLGNSSDGRVEYHVAMTTEEDSGYYVCVARLLDLQQTLKVNHLKIGSAPGKKEEA